MAAALRVFLAILAGTVVAVGLPREAGREVLLIPRWSTAPDRAVQADAPRDTQPIVLTTSARFALVDTITGTLLHAGLQADVFTATADMLINQSSTVPQWAVQTWGGAIVRIVPRRGIPRIHGDRVVQFSDDGRIAVTDLATGEEIVVPGPKDATVYAVADDGGYLALGTLEGIVRVVSLRDDEWWEYRFDGNGESEDTPVVYGLAFFPAAEPDLPPRLLAVQGLEPQRLVLMTATEQNLMSADTVTRVPDDRAVRWPAVIDVRPSGAVAVGLRETMMRVTAGSDEVELLDLPGGQSFGGVTAGADGAEVISGTGVRGAVVGVRLGHDPTVVPWRFPGGRVVASVPPDADGAENGLTILRRDGSFVALEVGW